MPISFCTSSFYKIKLLRYVMPVCLCLVLTTATGQTQQSQPATAATVQKIALVDYSSLRKQYHALKLAKDSVRKESQDWQQQYQSKQKGQFSQQQKQWLQQRDVRFRQYESRIRAAINKVMAEGGFTDVQPLTKEGAQNGIDITDQVLQKLN